MALQEHDRVHCLGRTLDVFHHEAVYTPTALPVGKDHYDFPEVIAHKALISDNFPGNSLSAITESLSNTVRAPRFDPYWFYGLIQVGMNHEKSSRDRYFFSTLIG